MNLTPLLTLTFTLTILSISGATPCKPLSRHLLTRLAPELKPNDCHPTCASIWSRATSHSICMVDSTIKTLHRLYSSCIDNCIPSHQLNETRLEMGVRPRAAFDVKARPSSPYYISDCHCPVRPVCSPSRSNPQICWCKMKLVCV